MTSNSACISAMPETENVTINPADGCDGVALSLQRSATPIPAGENRVSESESPPATDPCDPEPPNSDRPSANLRYSGERAVWPYSHIVKMTAGSSGQWVKKISGKVYYFGVLSDPDAALAKWTRLFGSEKQRWAEVPDVVSGIKGIQMFDNLDGKPIVYFLIVDGEVVYVGQSVELPRRLSGHARVGRKWDQVAYIVVDEPERLSVVEEAFIIAMKPLWNKRVESVPHQGHMTALDKYADQDACAAIRRLYVKAERERARTLRYGFDPRTAI